MESLCHSLWRVFRSLNHFYKWLVWSKDCTWNNLRGNVGVIVFEWHIISNVLNGINKLHSSCQPLSSITQTTTVHTGQDIMCPLVITMHLCAFLLTYFITFFSVISLETDKLIFPFQFWRKILLKQVYLNSHRSAL